MKALDKLSALARSAIPSGIPLPLKRLKAPPPRRAPSFKNLYSIEPTFENFF